MTCLSCSLFSLSFRAKRGICLLLSVLTVGLVVAQQLPTDWRRPTSAEAEHEWRQKSQKRFLVVRGDFDSDGKPDAAELLVNASGSQFALFVRLASTGKWQSVNEPIDIKSFDRFGIDLVKPGKYKTACGKGYGDYACAHGEPDVLKLSAPAIDLFYTESSDSIFYWDQSSKAFRQILMSD
jgi:hypothetical protein